jgi:hypothetical protein
MPDKQKIEKREVQRFATNRYEYPGKFEHELHAIYDPKNDTHMIIQYTFFKNKEQMKEHYEVINTNFEIDRENYMAFIEQGLVDENGNFTEKFYKGPTESKGSSLMDKVKKIKEKSLEKKCENCDDCNCK